MAKKEFKTPTEMFITSPMPAETIEPDPEAQAPAKEIDPGNIVIPDGYKLVRESKTERLQILIRPAAHAALKRIAKAEGVSKNEIINNLIEDYIKQKG